MPSTFFGLNIASSGMSAYQVALNTTANNISNLRTPGYTRQQANRVASDALRVHAKYGSVGTGVTTVSIKQVRNFYFDTKYWQNQSSVGLFDTRLGYLSQIEDYFIDDASSKGFSTILNTMFNDLDTLKSHASDIDVRKQFIGSSQNLATYFNSLSTGLSSLQTTTNEEIKATVMNINAIAEKIATLNDQINTLEIQGGYANELRDQRALLIDELSAIVPTEVEEIPVRNSNDPDMPLGANYYTVKIGGQVLVSTKDYNQLQCVAREEKVNQSDIEGLYDIKWEKTGNTFNAGASSMSGSLKALFDIRDGNNGENFKGTTNVVDGTHIKVTNPSMTSIEALTLPESGMLTINGKQYAYDGFTFEKDKDGNITSYTFNLKEVLSVQEQGKVDGRTASVGTSVDSMGIPYYMAQMNQFLRSFAKAYNDIHHTGMDLDGKKTDYYAFFTGKDPVTGKEYKFDDKDANGQAGSGSSVDSYYKLTASNICVSDICKDDPKKLSTTTDIKGTGGPDAYDLVEKLAKLKSEVKLYRGGTADGFLLCLISDISIDTQESEIFAKNFQNIGKTIENQRASVSGVDEDEEALDLIKFQNAYNLSSKMVSVMSEIYDRLILQTGV